MPEFQHPGDCPFPWRCMLAERCILSDPDETGLAFERPMGLIPSINDYLAFADRHPPINTDGWEWSLPAAAFDGGRDLSQPKVCIMATEDARKDPELIGEDTPLNRAVRDVSRGLINDLVPKPARKQLRDALDQADARPADKKGADHLPPGEGKAFR